MGDIFEVQNLFLFLVFGVPGFVSIKVFDLFVPPQGRQASILLLDAVAYSMLNCALLFWIPLGLSKPGFVETYPALSILAGMLYLAVAPALWAVILFKVRNRKFAPIVSPWATAWDSLRCQGFTRHQRHPHDLGSRGEQKPHP